MAEWNMKIKTSEATDSFLAERFANPDLIEDIQRVRDGKHLQLRLPHRYSVRRVEGDMIHVMVFFPYQVK